MPRKPVNRTVWVVDLEYQQHPFKYAGGAAVSYDEQGCLRVIELRTAQALMRWVKQPEKRLIYAHWGSRADFPIILHYALNHGLGARGALYVNGGFIKFWLGNSEYRDSIRLLKAPVSQKEGGKGGVDFAVGMRKTPLPYRKLLEVPLERRCAAASNHAEIVLKGLHEFARRLDVAVNRLPLTVGGAALVDVGNHLERPWPGLAHGTDEEREANEHGNECRYGGRTETFFRGYQDFVYDYDFHSSYSASCLQGSLPVGDPVLTRSLSKADLITAVVDVPESAYPPLPFRHDDTLFFPTGRFYGSWPGDELRHAVKYGVRVDRLVTGTYFKERIDLASWVKNHYAARVSDPFSALYTKLLLNNLFGKMQQSKPRTVCGFGQYPPRSASEIGSGYWMMILESEPPKFQNFPAAAVVLGRARGRLHQLLWDGHPTYACDTDSGFTRKVLTLGSELGELGIEAQGPFVFIAPKVMEGFDERTGKKVFKCKGMFRGTRSDAYLKQIFKRVFRGDSITLKGLPTQLQLFEKGELDFLKFKKYSLHLDRVKRSYFADGTSRAWTVEELMAGDYDTPLEDRGVISGLHDILYSKS